MIRRYELPYPPSVNHYWRRVGNKTILSREGREYRKAVEAYIASLGHLEPLAGSLAMWVLADMPDHRRRDLDNILKGMLDALQHAGVYLDDSQIDDLHIQRGSVVEGGRVVVELVPCAARKAQR